MGAVNGCGSEAVNDLGEVGSELTIDRDCPAIAPANADEPSMDCRSAKNWECQLCFKLLSSVDNKL